jgi:hypothetical protein
MEERIEGKGKGKGKREEEQEGKEKIEEEGQERKKQEQLPLPILLAETSIRSLQIYNGVILPTIIASQINVTTREGLLRLLSSCRLSQLYYLLLIIRSSRDPKLQDSIRHFCNSGNSGIDPIKYNLYNETFERLLFNSDIQQIYLKNILPPHMGEQITSLVELERFQYSVMLNNFDRCKIFPFAIVAKENIVKHYFTLIFANGKYYIYNSYGSDKLLIPPFFKEITKEEFNRLVSSGFDEELFIKFFLDITNALTTLPYSREDIEDLGLPPFGTIDPVKGLKDELTHIRASGPYKYMIITPIITAYYNASFPLTSSEVLVPTQLDNDNEQEVIDLLCSFLPSEAGKASEFASAAEAGGGKRKRKRKTKKTRRKKKKKTRRRKTRKTKRNNI